MVLKIRAFDYQISRHTFTRRTVEKKKLPNDRLHKSTWRLYRRNRLISRNNYANVFDGFVVTT